MENQRIIISQPPVGLSSPSGTTWMGPSDVSSLPFGYSVPPPTFASPYGSFVSSVAPATSASANFVAFWCQNLQFEANTVIQKYVQNANGKYIIAPEGIVTVEEVLSRIKSFFDHAYKNYKLNNSMSDASAFNQLNPLLYLQKKLSMALEHSRMSFGYPSMPPMAPTSSSAILRSTSGPFLSSALPADTWTGKHYVAPFTTPENGTSVSAAPTRMKRWVDKSTTPTQESFPQQVQAKAKDGQRYASDEVEDAISEAFLDKSVTLPSVSQLVNAFEKLQRKKMPYMTTILQKQQRFVKPIKPASTSPLFCKDSSELEAPSSCFPLFSLLHNDIEIGLQAIIPPENALAILKIDCRFLCHGEEFEKQYTVELYQKQRIHNSPFTRTNTEESSKRLHSMPIESQDMMKGGVSPNNHLQASTLPAKDEVSYAAKFIESLKLPETEEILWNMNDSKSALLAFCESYCRDHQLPHALRRLLLVELRRQLRGAIEQEHDFAMLVDLWKSEFHIHPINYTIALRTIELEVNDDKLGCRYEDKFKWNLLNSDSEMINLIQTLLEDMNWPLSIKKPMIIAFKRQIFQHKQDLLQDYTKALWLYARQKNISPPFIGRSKLSITPISSLIPTASSSTKALTFTNVANKTQKKRCADSILRRKLEKRYYELKFSAFPNFDIWNKRIENASGVYRLDKLPVNHYFDSSVMGPSERPFSVNGGEASVASIVGSLMVGLPAFPLVPYFPEGVSNVSVKLVNEESVVSDEFRDMFRLKEMRRRRNWIFYLNRPTAVALYGLEDTAKRSVVSLEAFREASTSTNAKSSRVRQRDYLSSASVKQTTINSAASIANGAIASPQHTAPSVSSGLSFFSSPSVTLMKPLAGGMILRTEIEREEWGPICWNGEDYYYCVQGMRRPKRRRR